MFWRIIHSQLEIMVKWWIGIRYGFEVNTGKMGKYFKQYLPEEYWEKYKQTYCGSNYNELWNSLEVSCQLFRILGKDVADSMGFPYPENDDRNMTAYIRAVKNLPENAEEIKIAL